MIDSAIRGAELFAGPGLHFHERQPFSIPPDQIDLAGAGGGPVVSGDDDHPALLQKAVGQILGAPPRSELGRPEPSPAPVARLIGPLVQPPDHLITSNSNSITFPRTTKQR